MLQVPPVKTCEATSCAYNEEKKCHAFAITVGDGTTPHCDTFINPSPEHGGDPAMIAKVGACKVSGCKHNQDLMCHAGAVLIGMIGQSVECKTYDPQ
jgi:hypothetical protein